MSEEPVPYEERDDEDVAMVMTTITIERYIDNAGRDRVSMEAEDNNGEVPGLIEMLGLLDLARDTAYHMMDDVHEENEDDLEDDEG